VTTHEDAARVVELATGTIVGMEALVRWQHPRRGLLPPSEFLPLGEQTVMAIALGRWVIGHACRAPAAWGDGPGEPWISVNLPDRAPRSRALRHGRGRTRAQRARPEPPGARGLGARRPPRQRNAPLRALEQTGVRIALDDFGAGQSALRWLQFLPLDMLKIDRGFTQPLKDGPDGARITAGIVELAGRLGFTTVAEAIEHQEQAVILAALGAEMGQGYHFSRPLPESRLGELLATRRLGHGLGQAEAPAVA
jgi:EAL domain-containing protein (putative c-di-GMP-specific phosphodiesterase class I)